MLLTPKRRKHRKQMVKAISGKASRWSTVSFGEFWLKATSSAFITNRQIEAARKVISRNIKKIGKLWIRVFPDVPITKLWLEMPMGKGKWEVQKYAARVKRGKVIFEITGVDKETATMILNKAAHKLSVTTRVVSKWEIK